MSRLGQGSDTTACPWCEGNIDPSGGYFSKLDDNHKSHNSQGFTIFSQFSRSPGGLLNHEWARKGTNGLNHERHERHKKLRTTNGHEWIKPRKTRKKLRTTNGHECARMDYTTNVHEWIEPRKTRKTRKTQNHEWTRMCTNGLNHERHEWIEPRNTRKTRKKLRTTNGHEWARMDQTTKDTKKTQNHEWTRISVVGGLLPSLACVLPSTVDGMQCARLLTVRPSAKWGIA